MGPPDGRYFPPGVLHAASAARDDLDRRRFSRYLAAMGEPPLWPLQGADWAVVELSQPVEVVRLLVVPTGDPPLAVRLMREGGESRAVFLMLSGAAANTPGKVARRDSLKLAQGQWDALTSPLDNPEFWAQTSAVGFDGSTCVLEAVRGGQYRVLQCWEPGQDGQCTALNEFGLALLALGRPWASVPGR